MWNSCSNGGRQGLIEAQRTPDFDGTSPARRGSIRPFTVGRSESTLTGAPIPIEKLALVAASVAKCDKVDGLPTDRRPRRCDSIPRATCRRARRARTLHSVSPPRRPEASRKSTVER